MSDTRNSGRSGEPGLGSVVWSDLRGADLRGHIGRDFRELYRFYLDPARRGRLESMGRIPRTFWIIGWLLKSLLLKLSPARRFMLLIAMVFGILGWTNFSVADVHVRFDFRPWGFLVLLLVLMLELKDKLLAKDEIQVARQVQQALLPRSHPAIDGWEVWSYSVPANDVGGDLVDYVELGPDRIGVALGDVSGKGLGAALLTAKLQATLRALGPDSVSLDELGERMNGILHRDGLDNRFATLFYAELTPGSSHARYLNAGHNPPFLFRSGRIDTLPPSAPPLGMLPDSRYSEGVLDLDPGDMLVVYSDGLTEATNPDEEEFGADRLQDLVAGAAGLTPAEAGRVVLQAVERFLEGERPHDDLSVVVVRKT